MSDDVLAQLRRQLAEERRQLAEERRQLAEEQRQRKKAEAIVVEEQRRREEEQRRREEAEEKLQLLTLDKYLEASHSLDLLLKVATEPSTTTKGPPTNPVGRLYPKHIIPWVDFKTHQKSIWDHVALSTDFSTRAMFPNSNQLELHKTSFKNALISSEPGLRYFEQTIIEDAVERIINEAQHDPVFQDRLGLQGFIIFESHTNGINHDTSSAGGGTGSDADTATHTALTFDSLSNSLRDIDIGHEREGAEESSRPPTTTTTPPVPETPRPKANQNTHTRNHAVPKGKTGPADQFCIYRRSGGQAVSAFAIEYKAPHKLSLKEVTKGLEDGIEPERDVINQQPDHPSGSEEEFTFASKWMMAAVITQLFSYMITKGTRFGYICTGEAFVFLHIPADDPTVVQYAVSVPRWDVTTNDKSTLRFTAVAQVLAFALQSLRAKPPAQSWFDRTKSLKTWMVEFEDVLKKIPESVKKKKTQKLSPQSLAYKPHGSLNHRSSPVRTRSASRRLDDVIRRRDDEDDSDGGGPGLGDTASSSPSVTRATRQGTRAATTHPNRPRGSGAQGKGGGKHSQRDCLQTEQKQSIHDRPYCTQKCLLGLAYGGPMDEQCPNFPDHGREHITRHLFLRLIRTQLAEDRGPDADATPLYHSGAVGTLVKVRLSSHGYTLVAKGVKKESLRTLQHENNVYKRLQSIQGKHVPVCLGLADLILPYYVNGTMFTYFMFLGFGGAPIRNWIAIMQANQERNGGDSHWRQFDRKVLIKAVTEAFSQIHALQVIHHDAEPRNILYDEQTQKLMVVDFERAELRERCAQHRPPLGSIGQGRVRKHGRDELPSSKKSNGRTTIYETEKESAVQGVLQCIR